MLIVDECISGYVAVYWEQGPDAKCGPVEQWSEFPLEAAAKALEMACESSTKREVLL